MLTVTVQGLRISRKDMLMLAIMKKEMSKPQVKNTPATSFALAPGAWYMVQLNGE
jgi:hypothetical protein